MTLLCLHALLTLTVFPLIFLPWLLHCNITCTHSFILLSQLPCLIFLTFHLPHSTSLKTSLDNQPHCTDRVPLSPSSRLFWWNRYFSAPTLSLFTLANQLRGVPICGQIVAASSHSAFLQFAFNFPLCSVLLLVSVFAAHSFYKLFEHNFPSCASEFSFLSPRVILSYSSLLPPFLWSFSFNIPSCSPFRYTAFVTYSTLPKGLEGDTVQ
jgi:hypothetical protein